MSEISCEEVLAEIQDYLHGELPPEHSAALVGHIAECRDCFDHSEFQRRLKQIIREKCRTETPEHLILRIRETIRLERRDLR